MKLYPCADTRCRNMVTIPGAYCPECLKRQQDAPDEKAERIREYERHHKK